MAKKQRMLFSILVLGLLLGIQANPLQAMPPANGYTSNQYTQPDTVNTEWENNQEIPDTYEQIGENELFQLYANSESLSFKVVDKRSGYVWHSNLDEVTKDDRLNRTWTAFAQSGISIDYLDQKAIDKRASITNADHTIDYKRIDQGFEATVVFTDPGITLGVVVKLEPAGVSVEVPFSSIKQENEDFKLGLLYVYPFFGATIEDNVPGYMLIPDGSGSLIRFAPNTKASNMFYGRYYGTDLGMEAYLPWDPTINRPNRISVPVFGMVHGYKQQAYLSIVEKGASYGEIQAHPAGVITKWNFLFNTFIYNESYYQATNRSGAGVTTLQRNTNSFDIKIHYRFLTGDESDYVGMAKNYQKYLVEKGTLQQSTPPGTNIGIRLEFLAGEKEKVLFWHRSIPMTTISQMADILNQLEVKNPDVVYYGWQPLGASSMPPKSFKLDSELGTVSELKSLAQEIASEGGRFSLYLDPQAALRGEGGYSTRYDLAMSITNFNLIGYNRQKVNFYLNAGALNERYSSLSQDVFSRIQAGLALDGIGTMLYSDFKNSNFLNREEAILRYQEMLERNGASGSTSGTAFYKPNDYLFKYAKAYYDIPLTNNGYIFSTDTVPFLQIVFAGYTPYYGSALNFSSNLRDDLLRHADFGTYPAYFLTNEATAKILNTPSNWIYTSSFSQWGKEIEQTYQWLDGLLGPVKGQGIIAREVLAEGIAATTYENGKQIVVNYTNEAFSTIDMTIAGKEAIIREVNP